MEVDPPDCIPRRNPPPCPLSESCPAALRSAASRPAANFGRPILPRRCTQAPAQSRRPDPRATRNLGTVTPPRRVVTRRSVHSGADRLRSAEAETARGTSCAGHIFCVSATNFRSRSRAGPSQRCRRIGTPVPWVRGAADCHPAEREPNTESVSSPLLPHSSRLLPRRDRVGASEPRAHGLWAQQPPQLARALRNPSFSGLFGALHLLPPPARPITPTATEPACLDLDFDLEGALLATERCNASRVPHRPNSPKSPETAAPSRGRPLRTDVSRETARVRRAGGHRLTGASWRRHAGRPGARGPRQRRPSIRPTSDRQPIARDCA